MSTNREIINVLGRIIDRFQTTQAVELELAHKEVESTHPLSAERAMTHARCAYTYRQLIADLSTVHANLTAEYVVDIQSEFENLPEWEAQGFNERVQGFEDAALRLINGGLSDDSQP